LREIIAHDKALIENRRKRPNRPEQKKQQLKREIELEFTPLGPIGERLINKDGH